MRFRKILKPICLCLSLLVLNVGMTVQAEGTGVPSESVICAIPQGEAEDSVGVRYFETLDEALTYAGSNEKCTLKLLKDVSSATEIKITSGDFTFDLNGKRLSANIVTGTCISVQEASVYFKDSSPEKTGTVKGSSSAISISGNAKVTIESGNYEANSWGITTTDTDDTQMELKITGGCFKGNVGIQTSTGENHVISGGEFYGTQNAINNSGKIKITGGTFYGEIYNAGRAVIDFQSGTIIVSEESSYEKAGIHNQGTLNLHGGKIFAAKDAKEPMKGVVNGKDATLNLYGDVTFDDGVVTDFQLDKEMNICGDLKNRYSVTMDIPADSTEVVFAEAKEDAQLDKSDFISGVSGYIVTATNDKLSLSKCTHEKINDKFVCEDCGIQMYAQIGDTYYESLGDAFTAAKGAAADDNLTVKLLEDVTADAQIDGGDFTFDLNGHAIEAELYIAKGNVTSKGNNTGSDEEYIQELKINKDANVEINGISIKGEGPIINSGTLSMIDGKIIGEEAAVNNIGGTVNLSGGEIRAEKIGVANLGGTVTIGKENGTGPSIKAPVGILNSTIVVEENVLDAILNINGGTFASETDIYNKTGKYDVSDSPLAAGTVNLKGGTFSNGIRAELDEGVDLMDLLVKDYGYYGSDGQKLSVEEGTVQVNQTVTVKVLTKDVPGESGEESKDNQGTGAENTGDPGESEDETTNNQETGAENTGDPGESEDETTNNQETIAVNTGDTSNIGIWLVCILVSGAIICRKIRHYNKENY